MKSESSSESSSRSMSDSEASPETRQASRAPIIGERWLRPLAVVAVVAGSARPLLEVGGVAHAAAEVIVSIAVGLALLSNGAYRWSPTEESK